MMPCLPRFPHSGEFCCCCSRARTLFYYCAFCYCLVCSDNKIATFNFQNYAELERRFTNVSVPSFARSWARLLVDMPSCISFKYHHWMLIQRRNAHRTAVTNAVLMNSRTQKILCCIVAIVLSTDAAARLCTRQVL